MLSRCRASLLTLCVPLTLFAQSPAPVAVAPTGGVVTAMPNAESREVAICDGSEVRSARHRGVFGLTLMGLSLPVSLTGMYMTVHSPNHPEGPVATGLALGAGMAIAGFAVASSARPSESFWERAIGRMRTGQTRTADVRTCLSRPVAMTSTDSLEEWTYLTSRFSPRVKSVKLTFRDGVLVGIKRAEVDAALLDQSRAPASVLQVPPIVIPSPPTVIPPSRH